MASTQRKKVYAPLTDGLNDKLNPALLNEREAAEIINWELNERGVIEKYKGFIKDGSPFPDDAVSFIRMLKNYRRGTSIDLLIMAAQDDANANATFKVDLRKTTGDGTYPYIGHTLGTADFINGNTAVTGTGTTWLTNLKAGDKIKVTAQADSVYTEIASVNSDTGLTLVSGGYLGATSGGAVAYIARILLNKQFIPASDVFNNKIIITNGADTPLTFDNTSLNLIADTEAPKAKYIVAHKNRVFMASTSANPSRIFWSAVNDDQNWDATSQEDVYPQDNGTIISIKSFGDSLIVLKNNGNIYQVVGDFDQTPEGTVAFIRRLDAPENVGVIAERTPIVHAGFLYFLTETGIYRVDQRMFVEKFTFAIDNFIKGINFALGPSSSKSHNLDTTAEWSSGTLDGLRISAGTARPIFDEFTISNAKHADGICAVATDSTGDIHVVYVDSTNDKVIKYVKIEDDGTTTTETAVTETATILHLSLDVAPNGNVGVMYQSNVSNFGIRFVERTTAWLASESIVATGGAFIPSFKYRSDNLARGCLIANTGPNNAFIRYAKRSGTTWVTNTILTNLPGDGTLVLTRPDFTLNASDLPRFIWQDSINNKLQYIVGDGDFGTITENKSISTTSFDTSTRPQLSIDTSGNEFVVYGDNGQILKRDLDADTTSVLEASDSHVIGYAIDQDDDKDAYYFLNSSGTENKVFEDTTKITNGTTGTGDTSGIFVGNPGYATNDTVFVSMTFGANTNELIVRRIAYRSIYTGPEFSDATLTAWGTYDIGDQTENGATITHEVATNTISPPTAFNTITNGQIVESDANRVFVKNKITFVLGSWATPEIGSIIMNYTGSGIDARQPIGVSFNNELFYSMSQSGTSFNNRVIVVDIANSILKTSYSVYAMERFKSKLYAGDSSNGDLLILKEGANFGGLAYTADIQSKEDFLESIESEKDIFKFYVLYEVKDLGQFDFSFRLDSFKTSGGSTYKSTSVDMTSAGFTEIPVGNRARSVQWRIENKNKDECPTILAVVIVYGILNIR